MSPRCLSLVAMTLIAGAAGVRAQPPEKPAAPTVELKFTVVEVSRNRLKNADPALVREYQALRKHEKSGYFTIRDKSPDAIMALIGKLREARVATLLSEPHVEAASGRAFSLRLGGPWTLDETCLNFCVGTGCQVAPRIVGDGQILLEMDTEVPYTDLHPDDMRHVRLLGKVQDGGVFGFGGMRQTHGEDFVLPLVGDLPMLGGLCQFAWEKFVAPTLTDHSVVGSFLLRMVYPPKSVELLVLVRPHVVDAQVNTQKGTTPTGN